MTATELEAMMNNFHTSLKGWSDSGRPFSNTWIRVTPTDCRLCTTDDAWTDAKTVFRLRLPEFLDPFYLLKAIEKPRATRQFGKAIRLLRKRNLHSNHVQEAGLIVANFVAQTFEHQINFDLLVYRSSL